SRVWKTLTKLTTTAMCRQDQWTAKRLRASRRIQAKKSQPSQMRGAHTRFFASWPGGAEGARGMIPLRRGEAGGGARGAWRAGGGGAVPGLLLPILRKTGRASKTSFGGRRARGNDAGSPGTATGAELPTALDRRGTITMTSRSFQWRILTISSERLALGAAWSSGSSPGS